MAESFSVERRKLLRFLGAKVVLTPAAEKGTGMLAKAVELAETHGWFLCRQFENEANADVHSRTTAQEILADFAGERLDYWVTGFGTGGTLKGVARVLKQASPATRDRSRPSPTTRRCSAAASRSRATPTAAAREPSALPPAPDAGLGAGLHLEADRRRRERGPGRRDRAGRGRRGAAPRARARAPGRHLRRHVERRDARGGARRSRAARSRARTSSACCPTPASATCRRRCSRTSARR